MRAAGQPPLRLSWVNNWDANAAAFELDGHPHVALYGGAATLIAAVALAVARSAQFEPELPGGEPAEQSFEPVGRCLARRWPESCDRPVPLAEVLFRPPAVAERSSLASELVWTSAAFLLFHEATHHRHGHVRCASRELGAWGIFEAAGLDTPATDAGAARVFQAMEVDADATAVRMTLAGSAEHPSVAADTGGGSRIGGGLPPAQALRVLIVAVGVLFNVFDYEQQGFATFQSRRHPHPAVRMASVVAEGVAWAERRAVAAGQIEHAVVTGLRDLEWIGGMLGWSLTQVMREEEATVEAACRELWDAVRGLPRS